MNRTESGAKPWYTAFRDSDSAAVLVDQSVLPSPAPGPPRPPRKSLAEQLTQKLQDGWQSVAGIYYRTRSSRKAWSKVVTPVACLLGVCYVVVQAFSSIPHDLLAGDGYGNAMDQGHAFYREGQFQGAVREYSRMVRLRPDYSLGYEFRAMAYWRLGDYAQSAADETAVLGMDDSCASSTRAHWVTYQSRGYDYKAMGNYPAAIQDLTMAISYDSTVPDDPNETANVGDGSLASYKGRCEAYFANGQYQAALSDLNRLIARNPRYPENYVLRGRIFNKLQQPGQALSEFNTAISVDPHNVSAYGEIFDLQLKAHQDAAAQATVQTMMRNNPNNATALGTLGWYQYETGHVKEALTTDQSALALDSSMAWVNNNVGLIYAIENDWPMAKAAYAKAIRLHGHEGVQGAIPDLKDALVHQPHSRVLHKALEYLSKV